MADSISAFDRLVPRLEEIVERVGATPDGQDVQLGRDDILVVLEVVGRMARGFQVLERRGFR
jgi:hypothetical protein